MAAGYAPLPLWVQDFAWSPATAYVAGDSIVTPAAGVYLCSVAGTSSASPTSWPTSTKPPVADGTVQWRYVQQVPTAGYEPDWLNRLRGKVYLQFQGKPNIDVVVQALAKQAQDLEESGQSIYGQWCIALQRGAGLDRIGRVVGLPRAGASDPVYRLYLYAQIAANKSNGLPEELYGVFLAMLGSGSFVYAPGGEGPASFTMTIVAPPLDPMAAAAGLFFLAEAETAGVRGILIWKQTTAALAFCFRGGPGLGFADASNPVAGGALAGAMST